VIAPPEAPGRLYHPRFFQVFAVLLAYMTGHSMSVHLPKYIVALGGDISTVGGIFGLGMLGSLLTRPFVGRWIDRAGCRTVLVAATLGATAVMLAFPWCKQIESIYALRLLLQLAQAALLAAVAVLAARLAPPGRSAESLATLGIGGLAGMMLGPVIGDRIFLEPDAGHRLFVVFFLVAAAIMLAATFLAATAPCPAGPRDKSEKPAAFLRLVVAYWPGAILVMALCLAFAQTVPVMFIERFVADRQLSGVTFFFAGYSPTAIVLRIVLRRLPARLGRRRTLMMGMSCYVFGLLLLTRVNHDWALIVPAMVAGAGHCFSYPFLVDLAAERMPPQHRGAATAVVLGATDIGFLLGFLIEGALIERYGFGFTLRVVAATCALGVIYYAWTQRRAFRKS